MIIIKEKLTRASLHWLPKKEGSGESKQPTHLLQDQEQSVLSQTNIGTVSMAT